MDITLSFRIRDRCKTRANSRTNTLRGLAGLKFSHDEEDLTSVHDRLQDFQTDHSFSNVPKV